MTGRIDMPSDTETATTESGDEKSEGSGGAFPSGESPRVREYFDLRDALAEPGCPICARVLGADEEVLARLSGELPGGAPAPKAALAFRGLCNFHAWSARQVPQKGVGLAESYEAFLRGRIELLQRTANRQDRACRGGWWERLRKWGGASAGAFAWRRIRRCPACRASEKVERRDLGLLLDLITDMEFGRAFEASAGLCLPHLTLAVHLSPTHPNLPRLLEVHIPKAKRLQADLQDFIRRAKAPLVVLTEEERARVWHRVIEWTAGKAGVFGPERDLASETGLRRKRRARKGSLPAGTEGDGRRMEEVERLSLENAKLERRLVEVSREWAEESARRAALQFQVHKLTEDVKVLELNLAGARGESQSGELHAQRLREEIRALREEIRRLRGEAEGASDPSGAEG
jgi:hypothetical protein